MEAVPISMSFGWRLWQTLREFVRLAARLLPKTEIQISSRTDQMATEALNTYGNAILRCAYSYLHNMADAEEILQDTLLKLLTAAPTFDSEEHKKAWLLKVAANLSKNRSNTMPSGIATSWTTAWRRRGGKTCPSSGRR